MSENSTVLTQTDPNCHKLTNLGEIVWQVDFEGRGPSANPSLLHHFLNVPRSFVIHFECERDGKNGGHTFLGSIFDGEHDAPGPRSSFWVLQCEKVGRSLQTSTARSSFPVIHRKMTQFHGMTQNPLCSAQNRWFSSKNQLRLQTLASGNRTMEHKIVDLDSLKCSTDVNTPSADTSLPALNSFYTHLIVLLMCDPTRQRWASDSM